MFNNIIQSGIVAEVEEAVTRQFADGAKRSQTIIIEDTDAKYPRQIAVTFWGDKLAELEGITIGTPVEVEFRMKSTRYKSGNGWGTSNSGVRCDALYAAEPEPAPARQEVTEADLTGGVEIPVRKPMDDEEVPF